MSRCGFGQTTDNVGKKVKAILELGGGKTISETNLPSPAWVYRFFLAPPSAHSPHPNGSQKRALVTPRIVEKCFEDLKVYVNTQDPTLLDDPSRLFNSDETGFSFDAKGRKVCAFR